MLKKRRTMSSLVVIVLIISILTNAFFMTSIIKITQTASANPGDVNETWYNESLLTVTVEAPAPWITWYDFQNSTSISKLNSQVDVNSAYKFCVNITQNSSWADIDYVNITAWYDFGSESNNYNGTVGGNLNMFLQYANTSGTGSFSMMWPDDEVTWGSGTETVHNSSCHNLTFTFTPLKQVRHAPGDGSWDTSEGFNDGKSWNFNITVNTSSGKSSYVNDEYGIYSYSEISSAGSPTMSGAPGSKATAVSAITVTTMANANFSLSVNLNATLDEVGGSHTMDNDTVGAVGGDLVEANFGGSAPLYIFGGAASYKNHDVNTFQRSTSDIEFHCDIPYGQYPGVYTSRVYYHLKLETT